MVKVLIDLDFLEEQIREIEKVKNYHKRKAEYYEIKEHFLRKKIKKLIKKNLT